MRRACLVVLLLAGLLAGGCAAQASDGGSSTSPSTATALDFTATTVDGADFDGASLGGKPTVLWFWAPWCPTCRSQISAVADLATRYDGRVNVVGVGSLDDDPAIAEFAASVPTDFPQLADPDGVVWRHFGITEQSSYVLLDGDHAVVSSGYLDDGELADAVADLSD